MEMDPDQVWTGRDERKTRVWAETECNSPQGDKRMAMHEGKMDKSQEIVTEELLSPVVSPVRLPKECTPTIFGSGNYDRRA